MRIAADMLGPLFRVEDANRYFGPEAEGWVVTHRATRLMIWTGGFMSLHEAAQRLIERREVPSMPSMNEVFIHEIENEGSARVSESEMVERVAGAIEAALDIDYGHSGGLMGDEAPTPRIVGFEKAARAAIEAMREPTEAMAREGTASGASIVRTDEIWRAMINAALSQTAASPPLPPPRPAPAQSRE